MNVRIVPKNIKKITTKYRYIGISFMMIVRSNKAHLLIKFSIASDLEIQTWLFPRLYNTFEDPFFVIFDRLGCFVLLFSGKIPRT